MSPSPLVIWRLVDGKPGHMQQTLGLVRALARHRPCEVVDIDVRTARPGLLDLLRGRFASAAGRPAPALIVGAGHGTHLPLLAARRATGAPAVALMRPSLPPACFDLVIAPQHDGLREGPRVITTRGVLNPMQAGAKRPGSLLFLIGGPSRHVDWDDEAVLQQLAAVVATLPPQGDWCLTDSRRTPAALRAALHERFGSRFQPFAECPPGWLAERLAGTETVWVSEDSVSMVYEALTAGCRVGLLQLPGGHDRRVRRGMAQLVAEGRVVTFTAWRQQGALPPAAPFNEAERVAPLVLTRLGLAPA